MRDIDVGELAAVVTDRVDSVVDVVPASTLASRWDVVFGSSAFVDPVATGRDQGYSITVHTT